MHFLVGAPGAGKTVLTLQVAFGSARAGESVIFLTTLSESHDKLLAHASTLAFFDQELIGSGIELINLQSLMATSVEATVDGIMAAVRSSRVRLIIIDGFSGMRGFFESETASREFLYELGTKLSLLGVTLLISIQADPRETALYPELTIADGLLGLYYERQQGGHRRYLEVLKLRGVGHLAGLHTLVIGPDGMRCYSQFESLQLDPRPLFGADRMQFDLPELDTMLGGGLNEGTVTLLTGNPGTGKSLTCLHYLMAGAARGQPGLLLGFHESEAQVLAKASAFNLDLAGAVNSGLVQVHTVPTVWLDPDQVAHDLMSRVEAARVRRLVIDSASVLGQRLPVERAPEYFAALVTYLRQRGLTALLTYEMPQIVGDALELTDPGAAVLAENVILYRQVEYRAEMHRVLSVLKLRFSDHDRTLREFAIGERGITVLDKLSSAEGILTGIARQLAGEPT